MKLDYFMVSLSNNILVKRGIGCANGTFVELDDNDSQQVLKELEDIAAKYIKKKVSAALGEIYVGDIVKQ